MLKGHDIIYLAGHDFALADTRVSTDHIGHNLARDNRLLYVESVGLRRPKLTTNDLGRMTRKLPRFFRAPRQVSDRMWVLTPLAIPLHHSPAARWANEVLLTAQIRWASARLRFRHPILFVFLPPMEAVVGKLGESVSVYYCTDEYAALPWVNGKTIREAEERLLRKVTIVFATAPELLRNKKRINQNTYYSPHGVDFDNFARAQDASVDVPEEVTHLPHPIVGYFGAIEHWVDLPLIETLARARPAWSFVLIGKHAVDVTALGTLPNVHFLGQRPFRDLPRYGRAFDAAIIPFRIDELTVNVSPIKLNEYLAMGKPVVSTPLPAVIDLAAETGLVEVAENAAGFLNALEQALSDDSPALVRARQDSVRGETWEARTAEVGRVIEDWLRRRRGSE